MTKSFWMALTVTLAVLTLSEEAQAQLYFRTDNTSATLTSSSWGTSSSGPFTGAWVDNSDVVFTAASAITNVTNIPVGNFTVSNASTVSWTATGNYNTNGAVRTFDIGTGSRLTWNGQTISTAAGTGVIKNGGGTWDIGVQVNAFPGGFTLNAGTVIANAANAMGAGVLNLNGGILAVNSNTSRSFSNLTSIAIGGDVQFGDSVNVAAGTGSLTFSAGTSLGGANRTLTLGNSAIVTFGGIISNTGSPATAITFGATAGSGGSFAITNTANTFTGGIRIIGGEVRFTGPDSFGDANNSIVVDGGRLAIVSGGVYTLAATHNIFVGDTAGTSIGVPGANGTLTYNGVIADVAGKTGAWAKLGASTLVLGGVSTYTGATAISEGTLKLTTGNDRLPTGTTVSFGQAASTRLGTLDLNGFNQTFAGLNSTSGTNTTATNNVVTSTAPATLTLGGGGSYSFGDGSNANSGVIAGGISIVKNGTGTQTFGDVNTYTGTTVVNSGTLRFNAANSIGGSGATVTANSGGTLALGFAASQTELARVVASSGGVVALGVNSSNNLNFSSAGANLTSASLGGFGGTVAVPVVYSGTLTANGSNFRLGGGGGVLQVSSILANGAGATGLTIDRNGTTAGTVILSNANTFTGATNVSSGSLLATNSSGSATGTGAVNVNSGGLLGGTGTVGGPITVASGGTVRGDSLAGVGTLALGSDLTIASNASNGGKIQSTVSGASGAGNSKLTFTNGNLTLGDGTGKFTIDLKQGAVSVTEFQLYTINLATTTNGGLFKLGNTTLAANDAVSQNRYTVSNDFQYGIYGDYVLAVDSTGNNLQLTFTPVPEPGTMVVLGAAGLGLLGAFRRYRLRKAAVDLAA